MERWWDGRARRKGRKKGSLRRKARCAGWCTCCWCTCCARAHEEMRDFERGREGGGQEREREREGEREVGRSPEGLRGNAGGRGAEGLRGTGVGVSFCVDVRAKPWLGWKEGGRQGERVDGKVVGR